MMFEYEKKLPLTKSEYRALKKACCKMPVTTQKNFYFDTDDNSLDRRGITCRLRQKNGCLKKAVKIHSFGDEDCSLEINLSFLSKAEQEVLGFSGLKYQGELTTERTEIFKNDQCKMVVDRNRYLGKEDYELEAEYQKDKGFEADKALYCVAELLKAFHIIENESLFLLRQGKIKPKSRRFFERKAAIDKKLKREGARWQ